MSEFEDKLNELLNNPSQMERFANMAKSLMGGDAPAQSVPEFDFDPKLLQKISGIMNGAGVKNGRDKNLLEAMRPYLSEKRRGKMDKAMKLARLASIAELAAGELGGDGNV